MRTTRTQTGLRCGSFPVTHSRLMLLFASQLKRRQTDCFSLGPRSALKLLRSYPGGSPRIDNAFIALPCGRMPKMKHEFPKLASKNATVQGRKLYYYDYYYCFKPGAWPFSQAWSNWPEAVPHLARGRAPPGQRPCVVRRHHLNSYDLSSHPTSTHTRLSSDPTSSSVQFSIVLVPVFGEASAD